MIRFLLLLIAFTPYSLSQSNFHLLNLNVDASVNERTYEITGTVFLQGTIDNTAAPFSFLVPKQWNLAAVRNPFNETVDVKRSESGRSLFDIVTIERTSEGITSDTLSFSMEFAASFDTSADGPMFINNVEYMLPYNDSVSWLPLFGSSIADACTLSLSVIPSMTLLTEQGFDSAVVEEMRIWKKFGSRPASLSSVLTVTGIHNAAQQRAVSSDSQSVVTVFYVPDRIRQSFAGMLSSQLADAMQYFRSMFRRPERDSLTVVFVGNGMMKNIDGSLSKLFISRISPALTGYDTTALWNTSLNPWLIETAKHVTPSNNNSTAIINDGFALYLAGRYITERKPDRDLPERLSAISSSLTFFPVTTLSDLRTQHAMIDEVLISKGRYFFLMLEFLIGRMSLDSVFVKAVELHQQPIPSVEIFQRLCEDEYGSSLERFFQQWLQQSSVPELIMQWSYEKTPRGMFIVKTIVEQRGDLFTTPVPVVFTVGSRKIVKRVLMDQAKKEFTFNFPTLPSAVELDPQYAILRWLLELRISAHAASAVQYLFINQDTSGAEREALYTLQLDPNNTTGGAPLVNLVLGTLSVLRNEIGTARDYYHAGAAASSSPKAEMYRLFNFIRIGNTYDAEGKRNEALAYYLRVMTEGMSNLLMYEQALIQASYFLRTPFQQNLHSWFEY